MHIYFILLSLYDTHPEYWASQKVGGANGKEPAFQCRRHKRSRFNPWVKKIPWRGNVNPLQYSYLENLMDSRACWALVHGVTKNWTGLSE